MMAAGAAVLEQAEGGTSSAELAGEVYRVMVASLTTSAAPTG
jgi:hypothetical protein